MIQMWIRTDMFDGVATNINKSSATAELARDADNVDFSVDDLRKT